MSEQRTINCDGCGRKIALTTQFASESYLRLSNVPKTNPSGVSFGMSIGPGIPGPLDFHDLNCLETYAERRAAKRAPTAEEWARRQALKVALE